jgi:hypothetical protein
MDPTVYPRLATEEWAAYRDPGQLATPADYARRLIHRSWLDPDRATAGDLAAAIESVAQSCSPMLAEGLRGLTLADLHDGAAANLAERAEAARRHEQRRRRYPHAGKVIAQSRQLRGELRRRQRDHHARSRALSGRQSLISVTAAVPRGTRARGAGRPPAVAARRSSSRSGDSGDGDSGPGEPPPPSAANNGLAPQYRTPLNEGRSA